MQVIDSYYCNRGSQIVKSELTHKNNKILRVGGGGGESIAYIYIHATPGHFKGI